MESMIEKLSEEWAANSTDSLSLSLVTDSGKELDFSPVFTYPIFGESETIYGYKDLAMNLKFDSLSLLPYLSVSWSAKLPAALEEPQIVLKEYLSSSTLSDIDLWNTSRSESSFRIPGTKVDSFTDTDGNEFTVYKSTFADELTRELHSRMQIFILLFIEAGSYIDMTDDHWELYMLYHTNNPNLEDNEKKNFKPSFAGFCTVYNYFWYKDAASYDKNNGTSPYTPNIRKRISQFFILPFHQNKRVGSQFFNALFDTFFKDPLIYEISVEDPSEAFDDLRDRCDLTRLAKNGTALSIVNQFLKSKNDIPPEVIKDTGLDEISLEWIANKRFENKMTVRQFDRCVEMILLHYLDEKKSGDQLSLRRFRLLVKRRLYLRNKDTLDDMSPQDRKSKLQETFQAMKDDYKRISGRVKFPEAEKRKINSQTSATSDEQSSKKQKV